ncbi:MAG: hypothetical protein V4773_20005 [Verrucomicrobiota bacterium]
MALRTIRTRLFLLTIGAGAAALFHPGCATPENTATAAGGVSVAMTKQSVAARDLAEVLAENARKNVPNNLGTARAKWREAGAVLERQLAADPRDYHAAHDLAMLGHEEAVALAPSDIKEALKIAARVEQAYARAAAIDPTKPNPLNMDGMLYQELADAISDRDRALACTLLAKARAKFQVTLDRFPDHHGAANNMGNAFAAEAKAVKRTDLAAAMRLCAEAVRCYQRALEIKPDKANAAMNWGIQLADLGQWQADSDWAKAIAFWEESDRRFEQSLAADPKYVEAAYAWATSLDERARLTARRDLAAARSLWLRALPLMRRAAEHDPKNLKVLMNLSVMRMHEAEAVTATDLPEALILFDSAIGSARLAARSEAPHGLRTLGLALARKADAVAQSDLRAARALWHEAYTHFQTSLRLSPQAQTADNYAHSLRREARAVGKRGGDEAEPIWQAVYAHYAEVERISPDWKDAGTAWPYALVEHAVQVTTRKPLYARRLLEEADQRFAAAGQKVALDADDLQEWGRAIQIRANLMEDSDPSGAYLIWAKADTQFKAALQLNPAFGVARVNRAQVLNKMAVGIYAINPADGEKLIEEAIRTGRETKAAHGDKGDVLLPLVAAFHDLGRVLAPVDLARASAIWKESRGWLAEFDAKSERTAETELRWANYLGEEAVASGRVLQGYEDAVRLWREADQHFERAVTMMRDPSSALVDWAMALLARADRVWGKDRAEAVALWTQAAEKGARASATGPTGQKAITAQAVCMMRLYVEQPDQVHFLDAGEKILREGEAMQPGAFAYNLACVAALRKKAPECIVWLNKSKAHGYLLSKQHLLKDSYIRRVADTAEYQAWFAATFNPPAAAQP